MYLRASGQNSVLSEQYRGFIKSGFTLYPRGNALQCCVQRKYYLVMLIL